MKNKLAGWLIACAFLIVVGWQTAAAQSKTTDAAITRFIAKQAKSENGEEYPDARKIVRGDVNGDGKQDAAVLYTLEGFDGGNNYRQYIAVFVNRSNALRFAAQTVVGGKDLRSIESFALVKERINLTVKEYLSTDASCCPSKDGKASLIFKNNKLSKIKIAAK